MKKKIYALIAICLICTICFTGCGNRDMWDTVYTFDYAYISIPDGSVIEGKVDSWGRVDSWRDYEDSDLLQIKIDGVTYLVHSSNVTLLAYDDKTKND